MEGSNVGSDSLHVYLGHANLSSKELKRDAQPSLDHHRSTAKLIASIPLSAAHKLLCIYSSPALQFKPPILHGVPINSSDLPIFWWCVPNYLKSNG